jgi:uncharacterized protein HemX
MSEATPSVDGATVAPPVLSGPPDAPLAPPPPATEAPAPFGGRWKWIVLVVALLLGGSLVASRLVQLQRALEQLTQQAQAQSVQHQRDLEQIRDFEDRIGATTRRTEQLEQELTVFAGRDLSGDAELRRLREQSVLAEVDELLTLASSQLQISHDPAAAAAALGTADARLARLPRAQFFGLREALARDIERLRKAPTLDLTGMAIRLDRLVQGVDSWHLLADPGRRLMPAPVRPKTDPVPAGRFSWIGRELADTFHDLVRVRTVDAPEALLMPADQHQLMREHLRVRLLGARQSMLMRNEVLFRSDIADCQALIARYFDAGDPLVAAALVQLKGLAAAAIDVPAPSLEESQAALRSARPSAP